MHDYAGTLSRRAPFSRNMVSFLCLLTLWCILLVVFNRFPGIDLAVARSVFFEGSCKSIIGGVSCGEFAYARNLIMNDLRNVFLALPYVAIAVLIGTCIHSYSRRGGAWKTPRIESGIAALLSLALGCGLLVNLLLKEFSGRPRPRDTTIFGGSLDFVQAGSFAGGCLRNCSFISGEASSAGWLFCLIFILPPRWRLVLGVPLAIVSFAAPVLRVVTGAHYLSDAVLGWLSSVVIFVGVLALFELFSHRRSLGSAS